MKLTRSEIQMEIDMNLDCRLPMVSGEIISLSNSDGISLTLAKAITEYQNTRVHFDSEEVVILARRWKIPRSFVWYIIENWDSNDLSKSHKILISAIKNGRRIMAADIPTDSYGVWGVAAYDVVGKGRKFDESFVDFLKHGPSRDRYDDGWEEWVAPAPRESWSNFHERRRAYTSLSAHRFDGMFDRKSMTKLGKVGPVCRYIVAKATIDDAAESGNYRLARQSMLRWDAWVEFQKLTLSEQLSKLPVKLGWFHMTGWNPKFLRNDWVVEERFRPEPLVTSWRQFVKGMKKWATDDYQSMTQPVYNLYRLFRHTKEIERVVIALYDSVNSRTVHDAGQFSYNGTKSYWKGFFMKNPTELSKASRCLAWEAKFNRPPRSLREFVKNSFESSYTGLTNIGVAVMASKYQLSQQIAVDYDNLYKRAKTAEACPQVVLHQDNYTFRKLDSDDPSGAFLGLATDCCQHLTGAGSSCAAAGVTNSTSAFYVVEHKGTVVAQSWAWRGKKSELVFDSIEGFSGYDMSVIAGLFKKAANILVGRLGITRVLIGDTQYGLTQSIVAALGLSRVDKVAKMVEPVSYSDADKQVWLAGTGKRRKFGKSNLPDNKLSETFAINDRLEGSDVFCEYCGCEVNPSAEVCPDCGRDISEWVD